MRSLHALGALLLIELPLPALQRADVASGLTVEAPPAAPDFGVLAPQPVDVRREDFLLHEDRIGGVDQVLRDLDAFHEGGCAAVWSDERYGTAALTMALVNPEGEPMGEPVPVHPPVSSLQLGPSIAIGPRGSGGVAWTSSSPAGVQVFARMFDGHASFLAHVDDVSHLVDEAIGQVGRIPHEAVASLQVPVIEVGPSGDGSLVWTEQGVVHSMRFAEGWREIGNPAVLNPEGPLAIGRPQVVMTLSGAYAVGWSSAGGIVVWVYTRDATVHRYLAGEGQLLAMSNDPIGGGFFVLAGVPAERRIELRRLDSQGRLSGRALPVPGEARGGDLAVLEQPPVLAISVERPGPAPDARSMYGSHEIYLLAPGGAPLLAEPLALPGPEGRLASDLLIAAGTGVIHAAWTDRRNGDADIYYRRIDPEVLSQGSSSGIDRRLNTDSASADQQHAAVTSNGWRAAVAWVDLSSGGPQVAARALAQDAQLLGPELRLGRATPAQESVDLGVPLSELVVEPCVAMGERGGFLALWKEARENGHVLMVQAVDENGRAAAPARQLDPDQTCYPDWPAALVALRADRGYFALWVRAGYGLFAARLSAGGETLQGPSLLNTGMGGGAARHPSLALLEDGRLALAWDTLDQTRLAVLAGMIIDGLDGQLRMRLPMPKSLGFGDWGPVLAPASDGGFLMAWTGRESAQSDILAMRFDGNGRPVGAGWGLSTAVGHQDHAQLVALPNGQFVACWQDSLSGVGLCYGRRIDLERGLGAIITLHTLPSAYLLERTRPRLAPLGSGLLAVWDDCRRMRGHDVYARFLGPEFDDPALIDPLPGWPGHERDDD